MANESFPLSLSARASVLSFVWHLFFLCLAMNLCILPPMSVYSYSDCHCFLVIENSLEPSPQYMN